MIYPKVSINLSQVLNLVGGTIPKQFNSDLKSIISSASSLKGSKYQNCISFFTGHNSFKKYLKKNCVQFCLVKDEFLNVIPEGVTPIVVFDPHDAMMAVVQMLYSCNKNVDLYKIDSSAFIEHGVTIEDGVFVGRNCVIKGNTVIKTGTYIGDNTVICDSFIGENCIIEDIVNICYSKIGNNCKIKSGAKIGTSGFGFRIDKNSGMHSEVPQIGSVILGNGVHIGSNTCIDRGFLDDTVIGDFTKIDNLVQIGHGCQIGKSCFICGQAGLAGSTILGDFISCGGQAGFSGHIEIADFVQVAAKSGVISDIKTKGMKIAGIPAMDANMWLKLNAKIRKLANLSLGSKRVDNKSFIHKIFQFIKL